MKHPLRTLLLAVCCGLAAACTQRQERLKLMSYNIRNGIGIDNIQDIGRIARVILREAPDLVALQELDSATLRVDGRYIPGELGRMTGMHATFGRAIGFAGGSYGIGLLSRTEPLAVRSIPLPGREEARVLLDGGIPGLHGMHHPPFADAPKTGSPRCRSSAKPPTHAANRCCWPGISTQEMPRRCLRGWAAGFRILSDTTRMTFPSDNPAVRIDYILGRGAAHVGHGRGKRRRPVRPRHRITVRCG